MAQVTIEGSVMPSAFLPRGERRTVERSDFIDKLIRRGFVTVVPAPEPVAEEVPEISGPQGVDPDEGESEPVAVDVESEADGGEVVGSHGHEGTTGE